MLSFLKRPYPITKSAERRLLSAILFGLFVFGFLYFFLPFGLSTLKTHVLFTCSVFGLICSGCMLLFSFVITALFPRYFSEQHWNVGREILWVLVHLVVIGFFNALFAMSIGMGDFSLKLLLLFLSFTVILGIFPITVSVLLKEASLNRKYSTESGSLNNTIKEHPVHDHPEEKEMVLRSDNKDEDLMIRPSSVLLLSAADNYVEVLYLKDDEPRKHLLRATLKNLEDSFSGHSSLLRVHKSYLVNLDHVERVSGNAQGYRLHLKNCTEVVPVSRKNNVIFRERLGSLSK